MQSGGQGEGIAWSSRLRRVLEYDLSDKWMCRLIPELANLELLLERQRLTYRAYRRAIRSPICWMSLTLHNLLLVVGVCWLVFHRPPLPIWFLAGFASYFICMVAWYVLFFFQFKVAVRHELRLMSIPICGRCGYDLTGNVSGRCPECGTAVAQTSNS